MFTDDVYLRALKSGFSAKGKKALIKYVNGAHLSRTQAIEAYCYECSGFYEDGARDCEITLCPLYPYMPYKGKEIAVNE